VEYFVLGDEDTVLGFRYAGVPGHVVRTPEEARAALAEQVEAGRAGVIIVTEDVERMIRLEVDRLRFGSGPPIVVSVPGPGGPARERRDLLAVIREALGIKV